MKRVPPSLLTGTCFVASLTVVTAVVAVPQVVRIVLGVLIVFVLPGFALVSMVPPERQLSGGERLLASVGMSLAIATCATVLLGATPIGLTRSSLAVVLGVFTIALSVCAEVRRHSAGTYDRKARMHYEKSRP